MAAEQGKENAQYWLGVLYLDHLNQEEEGIKWLSKATSSGFDGAKEKLIEKLVDLAEKYYFGSNGAPVNYDLCYKYALQAAELGSSKGQFRVGICFDFGRGVEKNEEEVTLSHKLRLTLSRPSSGT